MKECGEDVRSLFELWDRLRGDRCCPERSDVDVLDLKPWLGRLILYDVRHDPLEIRYRLIGSVICDTYGADFTGESIREKSYSKNFDASWNNLSSIATRNCFRYRNDANAVNATGKDAGERLFLPFCQGDMVNIIMAYIQRPADYRVEQRRRGTFADRSGSQ